MFELLKYAGFCKSYFYAKLPTYLVLFVTARCNFRCKMCFYWKNTETADKDKELSLNEISRISRSFGRILNLAISGGEPFLRDDLDQICKVFYENNSLYSMNIPTNGSMPERVEIATDSILRTCKKAVVAVELSLDGIGQGHDYIRGKEGSFENVQETYKRLCSLKRKYPHLWMTISTTFSSYNQSDMPEIIAYVTRKMPCDDFHISILHGNPRETQAQDVSWEKYMQALKLLEVSRSMTGKNLHSRLLLALKKEVRKEIINIAKYGKMSSPCTAIKKLIVIDERGEVFPCETIRETLGNLRDFDCDIKKVILSRQRFAIERQYKIGAGCKCHWVCAIFNNILYDPRRVPGILKKTFFPANGNNRGVC
ncbi:MAG: radical SAM protein [Candidatus Omnitrophota bacterium]